MQMEHLFKIEKIISGGEGLGRLANGMVVMCPFVLPGETVRVRETKRTSGYIKAELTGIVSPSKHRCQPFCLQFGKCGGCSLQHVTYQEQLKIKKDILTETLSRAGSLPAAPIPIPISSCRQREYRFRIRLHIDKNGRIGFHRRQSNTLISFDHCHLAAPSLNLIVKELAETKLIKPLAVFVRQIEIARSPAGETVAATLFLHKRRKQKIPPEKLLQQIIEQTSISAFTLQGKEKTKGLHRNAAMKQNFTINAEPNPKSYSLKWDSHCFSQVNPEQNQQLVNLVIDGIGTPDGLRVLDLFSGMGNFSIPLALLGADVTSVELNKRAIKAARANAHANGVPADKIICAKTQDYLLQNKIKPGSFDCIIIDPPRQGLAEISEQIAELQAKKIIYISCDPATLARDLKIIIDKEYRITSVTPVDMFPHTPHIESVVLLEKNYSPIMPTIC